MIVKIESENGESRFAVMLPEGQTLFEIVEYTESLIKILKATTKSEIYEDVSDEMFITLDFLSYMLPTPEQVTEFYKNIIIGKFQTITLQDPKNELN